MSLSYFDVDSTRVATANSNMLLSASKYKVVVIGGPTSALLTDVKSILVGRIHLTRTMHLDATFGPRLLVS